MLGLGKLKVVFMVRVVDGVKFLFKLYMLLSLKLNLFGLGNLVGFGRLKEDEEN